MVSADQPLLEVTDRRIREGHHGLRSAVQLGSQGLRARDMLETDFVQARESLKAIGEDRGTGSNVLGKEVVDRRSFEVGDDGHADTPGGSPAFLHGDQDEGGAAALELPAPSQTGLGPAHPRVVDLHLTSKWFAGDIYHRSPELVKHHPGGFVTPKPKLALKKQCGNTPLVGGHQVGCNRTKGSEGSWYCEEPSPRSARLGGGRRRTPNAFVLPARTRECGRIAGTCNPRANGV